ncbi:tyrosine/phenylalanine carboxypeptidase domain-containing protein [Allohahella sp. A8]|uniref:tyrosine/phenylalanine carboxypeptidase domain-containing protein n=1 Tax=Allohahella sp. A8 TaxID=3141461 RepID=UPI003A80398A
MSLTADLKSGKKVGHLKPLPPVAAEVDRELVGIDDKVDWLYYLSPLHNDEIWERFQETGYKEEPKLEYVAVPENYKHLRKALRELRVDDIEHPAVHALLLEKQKELELQCELVLLRDTEGFAAVSVDLFGGTDRALLHTAERILNSVEDEDQTQDSAGCDEVAAAAEQHLAYYRQKAPDLAARVIIQPDLNSMMMVHRGNLEIARSVHLSPERIEALMAHEIGAHVVTRYNGHHQVIKQLEVGLAHYDALQEGLGTLAEYLAGYLPPRRLRTIAARVVASDLVVQRKTIVDIFEVLHEEHGIPAEDAFDIAVRARRGGGLTKDSVYLHGLQNLIEYLADGGSLEFLYLGKFALQQRFILQELVDDGFVAMPRLLPRHMECPNCLERLERVRSLSVESLFQGRPES